MSAFQHLPTLADIERERAGKAMPRPTRRTAADRVSGHRDGRGWRTAPKVNKHGDSTQAGEKAAAKRHENAVKAETRRKVWLRSNVCEACGDSELQTAGKHWKAEHECHEVVSRAQTRGQAPEIRFSTENSARTCCECHRLLHRKRLRFDFHSDLRMDGPRTAVFL